MLFVRTNRITRIQQLEHLTPKDSSSAIAREFVTKEILVRKPGCQVSGLPLSYRTGHPFVVELRRPAAWLSWPR